MKIIDIITKIRKPKTLCVFAGRFQPFHKGHYALYREICDVFGTDNVKIASSNNQNKNSPFTFDEKLLIVQQMFGITDDVFIQTKQPYRPEELLKNTNATKTVVVFAISEKDKNRLKDSEFFHDYESSPKNKITYDKGAYYYILPTLADNISATKIRNEFKHSKDKKKCFIKYYDNFNESVFKLFLKKLQ